MGRGLTGPLVLGTVASSTTRLGSLGEALLLCGKNTNCIRCVIAGKEEVMRKTRDLNACISLLGDVQSEGSVNPEQKESVERVIDELKRIRRKPNQSRTEQHESIRKIVEELLRAFQERD